MKTTTILFRFAIALLSASLAYPAAWDLRMVQFDASNRSRDVIIAPAANSLLGFDASKRAVNITPGTNISISGNQISAAGNVTNNGTLTDSYLVMGGGGASVRPTTIQVTGGNNIVLANLTANSTSIGNITGATSDFELPWIGDQATGKFFKGNITVGPNMTRTKVGNNIVLDSISGGGGSLPGGMATLWTTADLGSLPADYIVSGSNGTDGPDTLGNRTVVVRSLGTVADPTVDIAPGAVPAGTVVTMNTTTTGTFFTATTNGTDPTYTVGTVGGNFTISANTTVEYRANKQGWVSSAVQSGTWTIDPIPTLSSAVLQASGTDIVIGWPESVSYGAGGTGGYALTASGGAVSVTGVTGGGTTSHTLTTNRTITNAESVTLDYTNPGNGAEDSAFQDVVTFTGFTVNTSGGPAGGVSYLVDENFEGTGTPAGWFAGSGNFDQSTSGLSLEGSECLSFVGSAAYSNTPSGINQSEIWLRFLVRFTEDGAGTFVVFYDNAFGNMGVLYRQTGGALTIDTNGGGFATTVATTSINTTYYVWARFKKGTGSNQELELWFSDNSTKPANGSNYHAVVTNGAQTSNVDFLSFGNSSANIENYVDDVKVATSAIP